MSVLVTGGAGYIGSHAAHALVGRGERIVVLDNLATGDRAFAPRSAEFVCGNAGDPGLLRQLLRDYDVSEIMHFAGFISVPESIAKPLEYYQNNVEVSRVLIQACLEHGVKRIIFSSTAAVYGQTKSAPVEEAAPKHPLNPYGRGKLMVEWMLEDAAQAHDIRFGALRYFNVAGVDADGNGGQPERQVPHLIKRAAQVALGRADRLEIYGTDYPTRDGTAVRDYIHIQDLVSAHLLALDHLRAGGSAFTMNCGYGTGASVREVVCAFERVTGRRLSVADAPRRVGDAASVIADATRLREALRWEPKFANLDLMVSSALEWERRAIG